MVLLTSLSLIQSLCCEMHLLFLPLTIHSPDSGHTWLSLGKPQWCSTLFGLSKTNSLLPLSSYSPMTLNDLLNLEGLMKRCPQHPEPLLGMLKKENVSFSWGCWRNKNQPWAAGSDLDIKRQNPPENEANREKSEGKGCDKPDWHMISVELLGPAMPECGIYCDSLINESMSPLSFLC